MATKCPRFPYHDSRRKPSAVLRHGWHTFADGWKAVGRRGAHYHPTNDDTQWVGFRKRLGLRQQRDADGEGRLRLWPRSPGSPAQKDYDSELSPVQHTYSG